MNPNEINKRIAIACGWKTDKRGLGWLNTSGVYAYIPNYHGDLNAMHEAEKVLDRGENHGMRGGFGLYFVNLCRVCVDETRVCATAEQRAEVERLKKEVKSLNHILEQL